MRKEYGVAVVGGGGFNDFGVEVPARMAAKKIYKFIFADTSGAINLCAIQQMAADGITVLNTLFVNVGANGHVEIGDDVEPLFELTPGQKLQVDGTANYDLNMMYEYL